MDLNLTIEEINYILSVLSSKPYSEVAQLISNIAKQVEGEDVSGN